MLKQSGWTGFPSGRYQVAMELMVPRPEIESRYGLVFVEWVQDGMGEVHSTYFIDDVLGPVSIHYYKLLPRRTGMVFVDLKLKLDDAVPRLREVFGLDPSLVDAPVGL
jgi:hypothetical protein